MKHLKILNVAGLFSGEELDLNLLNFLCDLETFICYGNKFHNIKPISQLNVLSKLTKLDLADNRISELSVNVFQHLSSLTSLDLSLNLIYNLKEDSFSPLNSLQTLNLNRNPFKTINSKAFQGLNNLQRLIIDAKSYDLIDLKNNLPFNVNCIVKKTNS